MRTPSRRFINSPARCVPVPTPPEAKRIASGSRFTRATNSARFCAERLLRQTSSSGERTTMVTKPSDSGS